ncbi:MAG: hypothetical protein QM680_13630 [Luteolibacter sp.]
MSRENGQTEEDFQKLAFGEALSESEQLVLRTKLGCGTASTRDVGTAEGDVPELNASGRIPEQMQNVSLKLIGAVTGSFTGITKYLANAFLNQIQSNGFYLYAFSGEAAEIELSVNSGSIVILTKAHDDSTRANVSFLSINVTIGVIDFSGSDNALSMIGLSDITIGNNASSAFNDTFITLMYNDHVNYPNDGYFSTINGFTSDSLEAREYFTNTKNWTIS